MPFRTNNFMLNVERYIKEPVAEQLASLCELYADAKTPLQKARYVEDLMDVLDRQVDKETRYGLMNACGQRCIGSSTLKKAVKLQKNAADLDALLDDLNKHHIGGGHLIRHGDVIHASYDRCYCGSVNKANTSFSATYCQCSCGWYQKLFETFLTKSVIVELLGSIIQGDERCDFRIYIGDSDITSTDII
jgi:hypothetical protein